MISLTGQSVPAGESSRLVAPLSRCGLPEDALHRTDTWLRLVRYRCSLAVLGGEGVFVIAISPDTGGLLIGRFALGNGLFHERGKRTAVKIMPSSA